MIHFLQSIILIEVFRDNDNEQMLINDNSMMLINKYEFINLLIY